jgi:predicted enzyme related to lactoylglutathione lyase
VNDNWKSTFVDRARQALVENDSEQREQIYNALIDEMESVFGKNDKEVAAELQRIAKTIEEQGDPDSAFAFKQRSCEMLLKRNMATRRAQGRPGGAQVGLDRTTLTGLKPLNRLLQTLECVCMPSTDVERDADFYRRATYADQVFQHNSTPKMIGLKVSSGPVLLLMQLPALETCQPIYSADDHEKVLSELAKHNLELYMEPVMTAVGTLYGFKDPSGNRFGLIDKKKKKP